MYNQRTFRKYQNSLTVAGDGVIWLGFWTILKFIIYWVIDPQYIDVSLTDGSLGILEKVIVFIVAFIIMLIEFSLRCYVGLSAKATARGRDKGFVYIILSVFLMGMGMWSCTTIFTEMADKFRVDSLGGFVLEIITDILLAEVIFYGLKIKRINKSGLSE